MSKVIMKYRESIGLPGFRITFLSKRLNNQIRDASDSVESPSQGQADQELPEQSSTTSASHEVERDAVPVIKDDVQRRRAVKRNRVDGKDGHGAEKRRTAANVHERKRMQQIGLALEKLKEVIPKEHHVSVRGTRYMSKINTLRTAINYIRYLYEIVEPDFLTALNSTVTSTTKNGPD
ncbi:hypothetical protein HDE_05874 [Halotydeus destructor]|nr:hypothetical protein HDE_05874 [Halotydeus destructor]